MFSIIILAIVQGVAEFLPISSSAHLIIFRDLFLVGKNIINSDVALSFDVALHFGTLLSIISFFFKDFIKMNKKMIINIIVATIPAAFIGFLFEDIIENAIRTKYFLIAIALIIMGIIIYYSDIKSKNKKELNDINIKDSILIGISQIFALIPGFSRSGTTIVGARLLKINRKAATRFSFYLSLPILLGAFILQLFKIDHEVICDNFSVFLMGVVVSFITGLLCIKLLINYIKKNDFKIFMWYRIVFGLIIIIFLLIHHY